MATLVAISISVPAMCGLTFAAMASPFAAGSILALALPVSRSWARISVGVSSLSVGLFVFASGGVQILRGARARIIPADAVAMTFGAAVGIGLWALFAIADDWPW